MDGNEHRAIGDAAFGRGSVNLGGDSPAERFCLGYGDVMALSGDFFEPGAHPRRAAAETSPDDLFGLARIPGRRGTRLGTRDELVCALKVMSVDEQVDDPRFAAGGAFADHRFSALACATPVERRVRDRYLALAATNGDHFVAPTAAGPTPCPSSARLAYRRHHELALDEACRLGHTGGDLDRAMAREAAAQHFLTDGFTAGHLRTPVAEIRSFWHARYPTFWRSLRREVASSTAWLMREQSPAIRLLPTAFLYDSTRAALEARTSRYPELSVGDFLARLFHDWDNAHGLTIDGGGVVYGDGHVHLGITRELALAAARAGVDDVEAAFELGARGHRLRDAGLHRAVRAATGAPGDHFRPETLMPVPSAANPPQNWRAANLDDLWDTPIVGTAGVTVGEALIEMMGPDGYLIRQLDRLGQGLADAHGLLAAPIIGPWLARQGRRAYHRGFVEPLAADPKRVILRVAHASGAPTRDPAPSPLAIAATAGG
jgi:hypothetical protein